MQKDISVKTRNSLNEAEQIIRRVPEVYRKELCGYVKKLMEDPLVVFSHSDFAVINAYQKLNALYNELCDTNKEQFQACFSDVANVFGA